MPNGNTVVAVRRSRRPALVKPLSDSHSSFLAGSLLIRGLLPADAVSVRQAANLRSALCRCAAPLPRIDAGRLEKCKSKMCVWGKAPRLFRGSAEDFYLFCPEMFCILILGKACVLVSSQRFPGYQTRTLPSLTRTRPSRDSSGLVMIPSTWIPAATVPPKVSLLPRAIWTVP